MHEKKIGLILLFAALLNQSCIAPYEKVRIQALTADKMSYNLPGTEIEVTVVPDVFYGQRNQHFSRMESRQRINLIGLRIKNLSKKNIELPEELLFKNEEGKIKPPLSVTEAVKLLCEEGADDNINVTGDLSFLRRIISFTNQLRKYRIRQDFAIDLNNRYLQEVKLATGEEVFGFLALPLPPRSPFVIELRSLPSLLEVD